MLKVVFKKSCDQLVVELFYGSFSVSISPRYVPHPNADFLSLAE